MNILITKLLSTEMENRVVEFSSQIGNAIAKWAGEKPIDKKYYNVEIEIPSILTWGKDIVESDVNTFHIENSNGFIYLRGKLMSFEENRDAVVQLGNSLILAETEGRPSGASDKQIFVEIKTKSITMYDINI